MEEPEDKNTERRTDNGDLARGVPEGTRTLPRPGLEAIHDVLARNLAAAFYPCPESLDEAEFKGRGLTYLVEEFSKQDSMQAAWYNCSYPGLQRTKKGKRKGVSSFPASDRERGDGKAPLIVKGIGVTTEKPVLTKEKPVLCSGIIKVSWGPGAHLSKIPPCENANSFVRRESKLRSH